jgi:hypothetical protein
MIAASVTAKEISAHLNGLVSPALGRPFMPSFLASRCTM